VRVTEAVARALISIGGILTIVSVATICVFLVGTVVPLFRGAAVGQADTRNADDAVPIRALAIDESGRLAWTLLGDGTVEVRRLDTSERIEARRVAATPPACWSYDPEARRLALGLADGQVVIAEIGFSSRLLARDGLPPQVAALEPGAAATDGVSVVDRLGNGEWRRTSLMIEVSEPVRVAADGSGIALIDQAHPPSGPVLATMTTAGKLSLSSVRRRVNLLTEEETLSVSKCELPALPPSDGAPIALALFGGGDQALLVWRDGAAARYDARDPSAPVVAERLDLLPDPRATVTAVGFLLGRRTLIVGDSSGNVAGWFRAQPPDAGTLDGIRLERGHFLEGGPGAGAVVALAPSSTTRVFAAALETGESRLFHMTSEKLLGRARGFDGPADALALSPRADLLVARGGGKVASWTVDCEHPEVSFAALARPVWYESHVGPEHVWQSTGSTDDFEPKLGFVPLVFGTLKSTLYSMLFGAPLALLAALFTSEFLDPRARNAVKSTIEIMASLPSVVLGFLAALVVAPFVQGVLPATLVAFGTIPLVLLAGAYLWQLVPQRIALRASPLLRLGLMCLALPLGIAAAVACAPGVERILFAGDLEAWLDGRAGSAFGGWVFLALPLAIAAMVLAFGRYVTPWQRRISREWSRAKCARFDVARFAAAAIGSLLVAAAAAWILSRAGMDPRGSVVGTYVQRNALVVGFVMGFAIVPLIYTLAEDALSSVPAHLRLASLGAGATRWQTAVRVIVPTAASGIFSALMVGLGRAVGETMIVLMAAGNTPVLDWNVFNGFRTLSANLAVELPEAVEGSTHYRTLFLAALVLFAITFAINTAAEVVRQRFRSRSGHL
jgi:phosphate transport system permease protein